VSEEDRIKPRTVVTSALANRRVNHSARSHPDLFCLPDKDTVFRVIEHANHRVLYATTSTWCWGFSFSFSGDKHSSGGHYQCLLPVWYSTFASDFFLSLEVR
jgi:hypothetical protein